MTNRLPLTAERPFPGPWPYGEQDAGFFAGRDTETDTLERLVRRASLTILFGASGLGKSSLLLAGLFPRLRSNGYFPVWVQLKLIDVGAEAGDAPSRLAQQVFARVNEVARSAGVEVEHADDSAPLHEYFKNLELWSASYQLLTPVIVLDQFEELFTLGSTETNTKEFVRGFLDELGDLVEDRASEIRSSGHDEQAVSGGRARVILSLREEYLPHIEVLRRDMPSVMRNRMRLMPMTGSQAVSALVNSADHLVSESVAAEIVYAVARSKTPLTDADRLEELTVEPSLLNLFCYQLNERRLSHVVPAASIDADLVRTASADILDDFIEASLAGMTREVREFVETGLLSASGYRLPVPLAVACSDWDVTEQQIETLSSRRLVRLDSRAHTTYVEIVHDVLGNAILRARERREKQAALDREKQRIRARERRVKRLLALLIVATGIGVVALTYFLVYRVPVAQEELAKSREEEGEVRNRIEVLAEELELARKELAHTRARHEQTASQLKRTERQLSHAAVEVAQANRQLEVLSNQLDATRHELEQAQSEKLNAEKVAATAREEANEAGIQRRAALVERAAAEAAVAEAEKRRDQLRADIRRMRTQTGIPERLDNPSVDEDL